MAEPRPTSASQPKGATGVVVFADGRIVWGRGFGAEGEAVGELCFNTAMTGYQEVMTDPSYAKQVIAFTFPHIGNVGANDEDVEAAEAHALGLPGARAGDRAEQLSAPTRASPTGCARWGRIGIAGVDTRALTRLVRKEGPPTVAIAHRADGEFDLDAAAEAGRGLAGAGGHGPGQGSQPAAGRALDRRQVGSGAKGYEMGGDDECRPHVVAVDYGNKRNIFRNLVEAGARVTVVPASATFDEIMAHEPDGFFLSNGPGDPAATGEYAVPVIRQMLETKKPLFGICLGHQMLALAVGGRTSKMFQGHRGANHPVKRLEDGRVEITSMNHGFAVEREGLPDNVRETHVSLFDDSNCGIELTDRPGVQRAISPRGEPGAAGQLLSVREVRGEPG